LYPIPVNIFKSFGATLSAGLKVCQVSRTQSSAVLMSPNPTTRLVSVLIPCVIACTIEVLNIIGFDVISLSPPTQGN
jgi:hypothetical protein